MTSCGEAVSELVLVWLLELEKSADHSNVNPVSVRGSINRSTQQRHGFEKFAVEAENCKLPTAKLVVKLKSANNTHKLSVSICHLAYKYCLVDRTMTIVRTITCLMQVTDNPAQSSVASDASCQLIIVNLIIVYCRRHILLLLT